MNNPINKGKGVGEALIQQYAEYQGDDCVTWPLFRDHNGRGRVRAEGRQQWAHRYMCRVAHGPPPSPKHQAAHSCGNGHDGCVNPRHLSWKTPSENSFDMVAHGTCAQPGRPRAKLTWKDVAEIRFLSKSMTETQLASRFGVTAQNIGHIVRGETWRSKPSTFGRKFPEERRVGMVARALHMRAESVSYEEIARDLGVARNTARAFIRGYPSVPFKSRKD